MNVRSLVVAALLVVPLLLVVCFVVVVLPDLLVLDSRFDATRVSVDEAAIEEKRLKGLSDVRVAGAQLLTACAFILGGIATWRTVRATRQGQVTEQYGTAVEHLAEDSTHKTAMVVGGVYSLERIARASRQDHWTIMELLVQRLRATTPRTETDTPPRDPAPDVAAIAAVLTRRVARREHSKQVLELWGLDLRNIRMMDGHLDRANLSGSDLSGAYLKGTKLRRADLDGTILRNARLQGTSFKKANLASACFDGAHLEGADFRKADVHLATFAGAHADERTRGLPPGTIRAEPRVSPETPR
jgi:Pentapeptide repeats (8 copies)